MENANQMSNSHFGPWPAILSLAIIVSNIKILGNDDLCTFPFSSYFLYDVRLHLNKVYNNIGVVVN